MTGRRAYAITVAIFGGVFIALGFALIVRTAFAGGGVGFLLGALFVALGAARLYLLARR